MKAQPLNLGGIAASGGGAGGPAGGFIGYLPQPRVAYDLSELETLDVPASGASLLDNLNHIRYRIANVEAVASGILEIDNDRVPIATAVTVVNFSDDFNVTAVNNNNVIVSLVPGSGVTLSGYYNDNLSSQADGVNTTFNTTNNFTPTSLQLYWNGVRQTDSVTILDSNSFSVGFIPYSGDTVLADYEVETSGSSNHSHGDYVPYTYLFANYYPASGINSFLAEKADIVHTHVMSDITDLDISATSIGGVPVSGSPTTGQIIRYDGANYSPYTPTIHQQYIFFIEGNNVTSADEGVIPFRIYAHDVNSFATITEVFCSTDTPPSGGALRVDVLKNGTSIFNATQYVEIPAGSGYMVKDSDFSDDTFIKNDYFQIELVQGNTVAQNLSVHVRFDWTL